MSWQAQIVVCFGLMLFFLSAALLFVRAKRKDKFAELSHWYESKLHTPEELHRIERAYEHFRGRAS
ncbi:MAG: hypothetical protein LW875_00435 [Proteobacteria bacterium]|jgi:hypothetical protein|nr:hypothetical protein [Pseudomonadota bacterium]